MIILLLIIYLTIGLLSNVIGPVANRLNKTIKETRSAKITRLINKPAAKKREDLFIEVMLRILTILFFPVVYVALLIEFFRFKFQWPWLYSMSKDNRLYYWRMGGCGKIQCLECNFEQDIVSFLHGVNKNITGYQCQECGKFHEIHNRSPFSLIKKCDCGGELDREKPIFCPICKSNNVVYNFKYIN